MKKTVSCNRFVLLGLCVALFAAVTVAGARGDEASPPKEAEWREIFADDKGYLDEYSKVKAAEETFTGTLTYEEQKGASTLMRWAPYKLDGVGVYTGSKDLKEYVGKKVEIIGKKNSFELEGQVVTEIWPVKIRLAAQEPPKAVEQKEIPAKAVNGLLFEIKLLNTQPLLPGDKTLEFEYRFTNVGNKEDMQLAEYPWNCFAEKLIGPDGQEIGIMQARKELLPPARPGALLLPGCFYGGKQIVQVAQGLKPGKYSFALHYSNNEILKDKGFNCWTGEIESNTIVFEVAGADVKPVNGIMMFIRMTKEKYAADEPVMVEVRFYNASDKEQMVYVPDDILLTYYSQGAVTDESGKTLEWKKIVFVRAPDVKYEKLAPGAVFTKEYDLRSVCKLPAGKYTFRLTSKIPWAEQNETPDPLVSNEVRFEVVKAGNDN